jgi:hypothetical protein
MTAATAKHFELIASTISSLIEQETREKVAAAFARDLSRACPKFDRERFMRACSIKQGEEIEVSVFTERRGIFEFDMYSTVGECFPDDPDAIALAYADLREKGEHVCGGGAAPTIKLTLVSKSADALTTYRCKLADQQRSVIEQQADKTATPFNLVEVECFAINQFGDNQHPIADKTSHKGFARDYVRTCLKRLVANENVRADVRAFAKQHI